MFILKQDFYLRNLGLDGVVRWWKFRNKLRIIPQNLEINHELAKEGSVL